VVFVGEWKMMVAHCKKNGCTQKFVDGESVISSNSDDKDEPLLEGSAREIVHKGEGALR
jgi:aminopeptidase C